MGKLIVGWTRFLLLCALGLVLPSLMRPDIAFAQELAAAINPIYGLPGTTVKGIGTIGYDRYGVFIGKPGDIIQVNWDNTGGPILGGTTVRNDGAFSVSFNIPSNATAGEHTIYFWVLHAGGGYVMAASTFTVGTGQIRPEIVRYDTFRQGVLVYFRLLFTDPNGNAERFGFRGANGSGWVEEIHPFSSPSYGIVSYTRGDEMGSVAYPFNHGCDTTSAIQTDVEVWIYDSTGLRSPSVTIHLACSAPSKQSEISYFALGDSIASGHGLRDDTKYGKSSEGCRKSVQSYPYKVWGYLATRYATINFHHLACSGATALVPSPDETAKSQYKWLYNQVNEALRRIDSLPSNHPVLVSITIGANDFEFADTLKLIGRLDSSDLVFNTWVDSVVRNIKDALGSSVKSLLTRPNVAVIITEYHNPFNVSSLIFNPPVNLACFPGSCYPRTEYVVVKLNGTFLDIRLGLGQSELNRLQVAVLYEAFKGHQSPRPICGGDPPDISGTWIQYPTDVESNSYPSIPDWLKLKTTSGTDWTGDCFHLRERGAQDYADAINADALTLGR